MASYSAWMSIARVSVMLLSQSSLAVTVAMATLVTSSQASTPNSTYTNPIIPGWNPDPSCTSVGDTVFCTTSSFSAFPGLPVYASKDLVNWRLASNAFSRPDQVPEVARYSGDDSGGLWASTLRERDGVFYLITAWVPRPEWGPIILLFQTTDPFDDDAWSDPLRIDNPKNDIDPDLYWDTDGTLYMAIAAGIWVSELDLNTGAVTEPFRIWNGTGDRNPEGPHLYLKDDYHYLVIGEGGTETNHTATIARSQDGVEGPFVGYEGNPWLTNKFTSEYFQTVGHADLFQDANGNWWGIALATRSGPEWDVYPMGRESVLFPVTWDEDEWPVVDQIRGTMRGPLPAENLDVPGDGVWIGVPDVVDFEPGSALPRHWFFWRQPRLSDFAVSPEGHPNTLQIIPSRSNLTVEPGFVAQEEGLGFIARKQTSTLFDFSIDVSVAPSSAAGSEAGVSVFLAHTQHLDLGIVHLPTNSSCNSTVPHFRLRVEASGKGVPSPDPVIVPVPREWRHKTIRLSVSAVSDTEYVFGAALAAEPEEVTYIGSADAWLVSGGAAPFTGKLRQFPSF